MKRERTYGRLLDACIKIGELGAALVVAEKQAELAVHFGEIRGNGALDALLSAQNATNLARMGDFDQSI